MLRLRYLVAPFALACAVAAAPATAQVPGFSVADQLQQQMLHDVLSAQQEAMLRSVGLRGNGDAAEAAPASLPSIRLASLADSVARYDRLQRQNRRWGHSLLAVGATALVGGFTHYVGDDSSMGMSRLQGALIWGGFGLTLVGSHRWDAAGSARVEAERWRHAYQLASQQARD
jgi:hypothetical protein